MTDTASTRSLVDLFRMVARRHPDREAVVLGEDRLTYGALAALADETESFVRGTGVAPGELVGVLLERSPRMIARVLGVLQAGAAYVPLDPTYPRERLAYVVDDARLRVVVGDLEVAQRVGFDHLVAREAVAEPGPGRDPGRDDAAYVIYTSGSTGRPKGCLVTHGNVLTLLEGALPVFEVGPDDRWSLFHSLSFDFSVWEIWGPIACGATIVVVPDAVARAPERFLTLLAAERVTVLNQVPSTFRHLAREYVEQAGPPLDLRYVIFGGEKVDLDVVDAFRKACPAEPPRMINMYGITETTVVSTFFDLADAATGASAHSPIGWPLPHVTIGLRNDALELVDDGVVGEMWIGGPSVCRGYLHRPELTAERFRDVDGVPYYRSGDLARRLPDGSLEYLGRNDAQVKVRGYRIELAEIEAVLRAGAATTDAAATVVRDAQGNELVVALVVPAEGHPVDAAALRRHARLAMPGHQVPNRYVEVAGLPLTASGKLDRNAVRDVATAAVGATVNRARVLVLDPIDADALTALQREHDVRVHLGADAAQVRQLVGDAEVIVLRSGVTLDAAAIAAAPRLRVIARAGSGMDNIDLNAARERGVFTFNVPGVSASAVAELAIGLMLAASRHIGLADRQVRAGVWNKAALGGRELGGKTLGMVGLGRIGGRIAQLGRALGMRVVAAVRHTDDERRAELASRGIELVDLATLVGTADVVCVAVPLTEDTHHLIDADVFAAMRPTAILVNVSRGLVVDEAALYEALAIGRIAAAGIDVIATEGSTCLTELDNIVITPHIGAMSVDLQARIGEVVVAGVRAALEGREVPHRCT